MKALSGGLAALALALAAGGAAAQSFPTRQIQNFFPPFSSSANFQPPLAFGFDPHMVTPRVTQYNLAVLFERGAGVPKSLPDAYRWYAIAAARGDEESTGRVAALAKLLSREDLEMETRAAAAFKAARPNESANAAIGPAPVSGG